MLRIPLLVDNLCRQAVSTLRAVSTVPDEQTHANMPAKTNKRKSSRTDDAGRGKRKRTSSAATAFEPTDFTMQEQSGLVIVDGRGKKLKSFSWLASHIEKQSTEAITTAHKFLYGNRGGKLTKKEMTSNLLDFSGYLEKPQKGLSKAKLEAAEEVAEVSCPGSLEKRFIKATFSHTV